MSVGDQALEFMWKNADKYKPSWRPMYIDILDVKLLSGKRMIGYYHGHWLVADGMDGKVMDEDPRDPVAWWKER